MGAVWTPDWVAWAGIGAMVSAITSCIAAAAAWRSADGARAAIAQAAEDQRASLMTEAVQLTSRVIGSAQYVQVLAVRLDQTHTALFELAGHDATSSLRTGHHQRVETTRSEAAQIESDARAAAEYDVERRTVNELHETIRTMEAYRARLDAAQAALSLDLQSAEAQYLQHREKMIEERPFG